MPKIKQLKAVALLCGILMVSLVACSAKEESKMSHSSTTEHKHTNHLIGENSPYLLSHAHNPVDWYAWGEEALSKAKELDRPIFLSIGYSACHWCHVMERESFENEEIAAILNENFISIKVDREQRPDLDEIYMAFTTIMTGRGGWPMSVFLTPDLKPFYAGTYFPPEDGYGRPGFRRLITEIGAAYRSDKEQIVQSSKSIFQRVASRLRASTGRQVLTSEMVDLGAEQLMGNFDHRNGGFGSSPKFPHSMELSLFLRRYRRDGDISYLQAAEKALQGMADGGIHDHVGGGFARYSTDQRWLVPHFEKMLYDNALLTQTYAQAYQVTHKEEYREIVRTTLDFIIREMTDRSGGFYSALDADSEGEEGKFYVWTKAEIESALGEDAELFSRYYNVTSGGNFEGENILNLTMESKRIRAENNQDDFDRRMATAREKLLELRAERIRPLTDDKILTSWNGLALSAFCVGYQITGDKKYLDVAIKNASFVRKELFRDGKLTHSYREGRHSQGQFLEDYGFYVTGLIDLYQSDVTGDNERWLTMARQMADIALEKFQDENGTFYLREANQEDLIVRPKEENDGAIPSAGNMFMGALLKLGRITGEKRYTDKAELALRAVSGLLSRGPSGMATALFALDYMLGDKIEIVVVGDGAVRGQMLEELNQRYVPNKIIAMSATGRSRIPLFEGRAVPDAEVMAYVCLNSVCKLPVSTLSEFKTQLDDI